MQPVAKRHPNLHPPARHLLSEWEASVEVPGTCSPCAAPPRASSLQWHRDQLPLGGQVAGVSWRVAEHTVSELELPSHPPHLPATEAASPLELRCLDALTCCLMCTLQLPQLLSLLTYRATYDAAVVDRDPGGPAVLPKRKARSCFSPLSTVDTLGASHHHRC